SLITALLQSIKMLDVVKIARPPRDPFHANQGGNGNKARDGARQDFASKRNLVLAREVEGLVHKHIHRCAGEGIAEEIQYLHAFFVSPAFALLRLGEGFGIDRNGRPISDAGQGVERLSDILRVESDHEVDIHGEPYVTMGVDGQAAGYKVANPGSIQ